MSSREGQRPKSRGRCPSIFLRGIDGRVLPGLVLLLLGSAAPLVALGEAPAGETAETPAVSRGDILFRVDAASFRGPGDLSRVEFYLAVPNDQLNFEEAAGDFRGKIQVRFLLQDEAGQEVSRLEKEYALSGSTLRRSQDRSVLQLLAEEMEIPPGRYRVTVELEDVVRTKVGLWYQLRGEHPAGVAEFTLVCPSLRGAPLLLSDIEFARSIVQVAEPDSTRADAPLAGGPGPYVKGGLDVVPNPSRIYGLLLPELVAYLEVYPDPQTRVEPGEEWATVYRISGEGGREVFRERRVGIQEATSGWAKTIGVDLSRLPAGQYTLSVEIVDRGEQTLASRSGSFQVAWSMYSWGREMTEILSEMEILLSAEEFERLGRLSPGEAEAFLTEFWKKRDPTPDTLVNEALQEHFRRIAYANRHFSGAQQQGMDTPRGRIYVRYGPPDDRDEGYADAFFQSPADEARSFFTPPGQGAATDDRFTNRLLDLKTREGLERALEASGGDPGGKRYEIWYFESRGASLLPESEGIRRSPRMRFVFLDISGVGDFKLVYSSEPGEY